MTAEEFRLYLAQLRETKSVQQIADDFGVKRQAVQQWIDGTTDPSSPTLKLAQYLKPS